MIRIRVTYSGREYKEIEDENVKQKLSELKLDYQEKLALFEGDIDEFEGNIRIELDSMFNVYAISVSADTGVPENMRVKLCRHLSD